jgi:hypothetical protein
MTRSVSSGALAIAWFLVILDGMPGLPHHHSSTGGKIPCRNFYAVASHHMKTAEIRPNIGTHGGSSSSASDLTSKSMTGTTKRILLNGGDGAKRRREDELKSNIRGFPRFLSLRGGYGDAGAHIVEDDIMDDARRDEAFSNDFHDSLVEAKHNMMGGGSYNMMGGGYYGDAAAHTITDDGMAVKDDEDFSDDFYDPLVEVKHNMGRFFDDCEQHWSVDKTYPDPTVGIYYYSDT